MTDYDVTLTLDHIKANIGKKIEYYALWDIGVENFFRGGCLIQGIHKNIANNRLTIYATGVWGDSLNSFYADEEGYIRNPADPQTFYYLAPPPFALYQIVWEEKGVNQKRYIPADSKIDLEILAENITSGPYEAWRINLDGSLWDDKTALN